MEAGNTNSYYAFLSVQALWMHEGKLIKHYYSVMLDDIKEDSFHTWAILKQIFQLVC